MAQLSGHWVTVRGGSVLLWAQPYTVPVCTVTRGASSAVVHGTSIIVQYANGSAMEFEITRSGTGAIPVRRLN